MSRQRFIQIDGELVPYDEAYNPQRSAPSYYIQGDLAPYRSMATGEIIEGRKQHREMLKATNCIEIGNEKQTPRPVQPPPGLKETLTRVAYEKLRYS